MLDRARFPLRIVVSMVVAAAVSYGATPTTAEPPEATPAAVPTPVWTPCPFDPIYECTTVQAPLDYQRPQGRQIELALIRRLAADPANRIGSLLYNPGGPAGPGTELLPIQYRFFPQEIRDRYDIVSWDPRGSGASTSVQCFATRAEYDAWSAQLPEGFPVGPVEDKRWIELYAELGRGCQQRDPELLRFVSTADSAQDMDLIRQVLGEQRLTYLGVSYGTLLGATYANLFPDRVQAMVIDGNVNPSSWFDRTSLLSTFQRNDSDLGSAKTLNKFLKLCAEAGRSRCPFAATNVWLTQAKYAILLQRLLKHPQGTYTYAATASTVNRSLDNVRFENDPENWDSLARLLQELWLGQTPSPGTGEDPSPDLISALPGDAFPIPDGESEPAIPNRDPPDNTLSDTTIDQPVDASSTTLTQERPDQEQPGSTIPTTPNRNPQDNTTPATSIQGPPADATPVAQIEEKYRGIEQPLAVICSESPNPRNPYAFPALSKFSTLRAGTVGPYWVWIVEACSTWPGRAAHRYAGPWDRSATPILTLNNIYDPATPYRSAQAMTRQLRNARLLTVDGYGHTVLLNPSSCASAIEANYIINGVLPPPGTICQPDTQPFS
ncbi:alpha/beta fold hydrolase [Nocardia sp. 004]|uniref:alpha/beta fold hydrolase n=1 Tax=Nocardia sp. 004 TaxID=3385978 RepID=UPI0039A33B9A